MAWNVRQFFCIEDWKLPATLGNLNVKVADDLVNSGSGFAGAVIHRAYQTGDVTATMEIISKQHSGCSDCSKAELSLQEVW